MTDTDKITNILIKKKFRVPSSSTSIINPNLETSLTSYSDITYNEYIYTQLTPNLNNIIFDVYYKYDVSNNSIKGYYTTNDIPTGELIIITNNITASILHNSYTYLPEDVWQSFIFNELDRIYISSLTPQIIKIVNLKTKLVSDTQSLSVSPSYYNKIIKDAIIDNSKGYNHVVFGLSGSANTLVDISNNEVGRWLIHSESGIIQFIHKDDIVSANGITYNMFSSSSDLKDTALFNKVKGPYLTFYRYIGTKGLSIYAKMTDLPVGNTIIKFNSNINFTDSNNTIGTIIQGTNEGGVLVNMNTNAMFNVNGIVKANKVISNKIILSANADTSINRTFAINGADLYYNSGNIGIGTTSPMYKLDVYGSANITGPSKIVIQGNIDGGSNQGLFFMNNNTWGIYLASSGVSKSLSGGTATTGFNTVIDKAMRFRTDDYLTRGFLWENSSDKLLMSLRGDNGDLYTNGGANIKTVTLSGSNNNGGLWLNLQSSNYGSFYQNSIAGCFGLMSTSQIQTESNLQWGIQVNRNANTSLFYSGIEKIITKNSGAFIRGAVKIGDINDYIIGNTDTALILHKDNSVNASTFMQFYSEGVSGYNSTNGLLFGLKGTNVELTNFENGYIKFRNNNIDALYINSNASIGINTTQIRSNVAMDINGNIASKSYYTSNINSTGGYWLSINSNEDYFGSFGSSSNKDFGITSSITLNSVINQQWHLKANTNSNNIKLYYNNSSKLETTNSGINIIDTLVVKDINATNNILINSNLSVAGKISINTTNSTLSLYINSNDAIKIPVGNSLTRPSSIENGLMRYNTDLKTFEGYSTGKWISIPGLSDINGSTYINAEDVPGANNNQLKFYTSNILSLTINSNQQIGVGTTLPDTILHINSTNPKIKLQDKSNGTGTIGSQLQFYSSNNNLEGFIGYQNSSNLVVSSSNINGSISLKTSGNDRLIINSTGTIQNTGNVGIGTVPATHLHIYNPQAQIRLQDSSLNINSQLQFYNSISSAGFIGYEATNDLKITNIVSGSLILRNNGTDRLTINSTGTLNCGGNVGIGTIPVVPLHINNSEPQIRLQDTAATGNTNCQIQFYNSTIIEGYMGYGAPVSGSSGSNLIISNYNSAGAITLRTANADKVTILNNGNVGVGLTTPLYQLHLSVDSAAKPGTNVWTISSDSRLKTNIEIADYARCYEVMENLDLKHYQWRDDIQGLGPEFIKDRSKLGWIADDVLLYYPKAVDSNNLYGIDNVLNLNSDQIYACMYGTIKKLMNENNYLKSNIETLNSNILSINSNLKTLFSYHN